MSHPTDPDLKQDEQRQHRHRHQGQLPGQQQHRDQRRDHRDRVRQDRRERGRQHVAPPADVVGQPGLDRAGPGGHVRLRDTDGGRKQGEGVTTRARYPGAPAGRPAPGGTDEG